MYLVLMTRAPVSVATMTSLASAHYRDVKRVRVAAASPRMPRAMSGMSASNNWTSRVRLQINADGQSIWPVELLNDMMEIG